MLYLEGKKGGDRYQELVIGSEMVEGQVKTANFGLLRTAHQITNPTARSAIASCATMTEDPSTMSRNFLNTN